MQNVIRMSLPSAALAAHAFFILLSVSAAIAQPAQQTSAEAIGSVATVRGASSVTRGERQLSLRVGNEIFKDDVLETGSDGALGVALDDETTLTLGASTRITVSHYIYQQSNTPNAALLSVARGTLTFFAGQVAKTGDMRIATPTAALGIRGTTGIVDVPVDARGTPGETRVKLYQDQGGTVGRIEIFASDGARLGLLSRPSTGFAVRLDAAQTRSFGQPRFAAVPLRIAPQELARDRAGMRQLFNTRTLGRQIIDIRRRGGALPPNLQQQNTPHRTPGMQQQRAPTRQQLQQQQQRQRPPALQRPASASHAPF